MLPSTPTSYQAFLEAKLAVSNPSGFAVSAEAIFHSLPYRAVLKGRKGYGCELNAGYWSDGVKYLRAAEQDVSAPTLFDLCGIVPTKTHTNTAHPGQI